MVDLTAGTRKQFWNGSSIYRLLVVTLVRTNLYSHHSFLNNFNIIFKYIRYRAIQKLFNLETFFSICLRVA